MPVNADFHSVYEHTWNINFTMCAPNGHLDYVSLCNLLQLTAAEHSISGGLSFTDMQHFDQAWVLSRMRIEIDALPRWQDQVVVRTWIESLQGANSVRNMEVFLNGKKIVGAATLWAVLNTKMRKAEPLALPHDHFEKFPNRHATRQPVGRLNFLRQTSTAAARRVMLSDLDIVNHANNVKYLEWCLDALDPEQVLAMKLETLEMNFLRELNLGDSVQINVAPGETPSFFSIGKDGKVCFALEMTWKQGVR